MLTLNDPELYMSIIAGDHWYETRLVIGPGAWADALNLYGDDILAMSLDCRMFKGDVPEVGGCLAAQLDVTIIAPHAEIPRMALIRPLVRATNGDQTSEWVQQGYFYIDTREVSHNDDGLDILTLHCYDAMLKTEGDYPSTTHAWPATTYRVVQDIAAKIGRGIDSRTTTFLQPRTQDTMGLPAGFTMREVLSQIGSRYAGNWIVTFEGNLQLILLGGIPAETNYLVDSTGDAITFGGDRILV